MPKGLDYIINLKDGEFGGVRKAKTEMQGLDSAVAHTGEGFGGLGSIVGHFGAVVAEAFALEKIVDFSKESLSLYRSTESAAAQVAQGIKTTGGLAGRTLAELREQAERLEHTTLFSEAQTEQAQAVMLTFTNIRGAIFDQAIPAIQNLATRMGGDGPADLKGASVQLGKALNDPITGINALRRVGVSFSDAQKDMIAQDVKHGQIQKAQAIILQELQTEFGGSAEAARKVLGPTADLNTEIEELKKGFGHLISDGLKVVVPYLIDTIKAFKDNRDIIVDVAKVVGVGIGVWGVYKTALMGVSAITAINNTYLVASNTLSELAIGFDLARAEGMNVLTAAQWALNVAMDANPIGAVIAGVLIVGGALYEAYQHSEVFRASLSGIGEVAKDLWGVFKGLWEVMYGVFTFDTSKIKEGLATSAAAALDVTKAFGRGYDESIAESHKAAAEKSKKEGIKPESATSLFGHKGDKESPFSISTGKHGKSEGGESGHSVSGGTSVRNVRVTINKLVETLTVQNTNISNLKSGDIKRQLTELLVEAVHDSELALGSQ